jgi:hypothetical protein
MAFTVNGCGTRVVAGRGILKWTSRWNCPADFDGLFCFCLFYLPLIPYRAVHAFDWYLSTGKFDFRSQEKDDTDFCRTFPIRWTSGLLLRTYLRPWLLAILYLSSCFLAGVAFGVVTGKLTFTETRWFYPPCSAVVAASLGSLLVLRATDRRERDVRRILGPAERYGGDPVTWTDERLAKAGSAQALFGADSYADAVEPMLASGEYARAMFAARLTLALGLRQGDPATGEQLTDRVLMDTGVQEALVEVRRNPERWCARMNRGYRS